MRASYLTLLLFFTSCAVLKTPPGLSTMDALAYPFEVKKVTLSDRITVAYADEGSGPGTILFVHGLGSYLPAWKNNITELSKHYRCIAIDLPGYGKSSKENYEGSMRFYAKIIREFCDQLGLKKIVLAGHSMGAQISIVAALAYPDLVDRLVLASPAGFETFNKGEREWFRQVMTADGVRLTTVEQIRTNFAYNFYRMPESARFMIDDRIAMRSAADFPGYCFIIPQCVKGMVDEPVFDLLPQIKQPVLVLFGQNDNLIPNRFLHGGPTEAVARAGAERIPNCTLTMLPKAGHFAMFEQAERFNQAVQAFLEKK